MRVANASLPPAWVTARAHSGGSTWPLACSSVAFARNRSTLGVAAGARTGSVPEDDAASVTAAASSGGVACISTRLSSEDRIFAAYSFMQRALQASCRYARSQTCRGLQRGPGRDQSRLPARKMTPCAVDTRPLQWVPRVLQVGAEHDVSRDP